MITISDSKSLDTKEILKILSRTIKDVYRRYLFCGFSMENYTNLVIGVIKKTPKEDIADSDYIEYIKNRVIEEIDKEIDNRLMCETPKGKKTVDEDLNIVKQYIREIKRVPLLSKEETKELFKKVALGDEKAKKKLAEHNLRLVLYVVEGMSYKSENFLDLIQEGNIGLMKAIETYDLTTGIKFSSYAVPCIKNQILLALSKITKNISPSVNSQLKKFKKAWDELTLTKQCNPSIKEVSEVMGIAEDVAIGLYRLQFEPVSIQSPICDGDDDKKLEEVLADSAPSIEEVSERKLIDERIRELVLTVDTLSEIEVGVLSKILGTDGNEPMGFSEIGRQYNNSRQNIEQIYKNALKKIRRSSKGKLLAECMDDPKSAMEKLKELNGSVITEKSRRANKEKIELFHSLFEGHEDFDGNSRVIDMIDIESFKLAFDNQNLRDLLSTLSFMDSVSILLKLGYIDGKKYNFLQISKMFNIDEHYLIRLFSNILGCYNENLSLYEPKDSCK